MLSNSSAPAESQNICACSRVAEVVDKDMVIRDGKVEAYRTKIKVSFKYEGHN